MEFGAPKLRVHIKDLIVMSAIAILSKHSRIETLSNVDSTGKIKGRVYLRCSTDYQVKDNGSIEVQLDRIKAYCNFNNIAIVAIYSDEALSGGKKKADKRLALIELEKDLISGEALVCTEVSRLGRNVHAVSGLVERLQERKVQVHIINLGNITGAQQLLFTIMCGVAAEDRRMISERVSASMQHLKAKGELKTRPKFGERWTGKKREYVTDPEALKVIEYLRELRKAEPQISYREMAKRLNETFDPAVFKKRVWRDTDVKRYSIAWNISLKPVV